MSETPESIARLIDDTIGESFDGRNTLAPWEARELAHRCCEKIIAACAPAVPPAPAAITSACTCATMDQQGFCPQHRPFVAFVQPAGAAPSPQSFWDAQAEWSEVTFGPSSVRGPIGALKHLIKEAREAIADPADLSEFVDCRFLVNDAARRAGFTEAQLDQGCWDKLAVNKAREWPDWRTLPLDTAIEHVRESTAPSPDIECGVSLIAAERKRQIAAEGWSPQHDDHHIDGELASAAACYAEEAAMQSNCGAGNCCTPQYWPFDSTQWKPSPDPIRNLVKAGALIAAEIDRLQRKKETL